MPRRKWQEKKDFWKAGYIFFLNFQRGRLLLQSWEEKSHPLWLLLWMKDGNFSPPLHPNQPLWQEEEAHAVLVLGTKGTVLVSSADDLIPFTSTANFNQEHEKGTKKCRQFDWVDKPTEKGLWYPEFARSQPRQQITRDTKAEQASFIQLSKQDFCLPPRRYSNKRT